MSDEKDDLTRIEDLSEYLHDESDDFSDLDDDQSDDIVPSFNPDDTTDPDINVSNLNDDSADDEFDWNSEQSDSDFSNEGTQLNNITVEEGELVVEDEEFNTDLEDSFDNNDQDEFLESSEENHDDVPVFDQFDDEDIETNEDQFEKFNDVELESNEEQFENLETSFDNNFEDTHIDDNSTLNNEIEETEFDNDFSSFTDDNDQEESGAVETEDEQSFDIQANDENILDNSESIENNPSNFDSDELEFSTATKSEDQKVQTSSQEPITEDIERSAANSKTLIDNNNIPKREPQESFSDLKTFNETLQTGSMSQEGNPPFSIILKDIKYFEDVEDIIILLKEFKLVTDDEYESVKETMGRGSFLIPRLSEYAAILLCHKLRRYDLNILMGLTEEISPPKSYDSNDRGLTTKENIYNNKTHNWENKKSVNKLQDIILSTSTILDNYEISKYISIVTENMEVDSHLVNSSYRNETEPSDLLKQLNSLAERTLDSEEEKDLTLSDIYGSLIQKLKLKALESNSNAIIGITFNLIPVSGTTVYQIIASGNLVWITKKK